MNILILIAGLIEVIVGALLIGMPLNKYFRLRKNYERSIRWFILKDMGIGFLLIIVGIFMIAWAASL